MRAFPLLFVVACGSSGSGTDGGTSEGGSAVDAGDYTVSSLDQRCGNGPSGADLMRLVQPSYAGTYTPPSRSAPAPPWTGSTMPSNVAITVSHGTGAITCHPPPQYNCPNGAPCAKPPPIYVTVDLDMTFKTADKTLDEKLVITARYDLDAPSVTFTGDLPATMIAGTYPISAGTPQETRLNFTGSFTDMISMSGNISELTSKISFSGGAWTAKQSMMSASDAGTD